MVNHSDDESNRLDSNSVNRNATQHTISTNQNSANRGPTGAAGRSSSTQQLKYANVSIPVGSVEKLIGRANYASWALTMKFLLIKEGSWSTAVNVGENAVVDGELSLRALATIGLHVDKRLFSIIRKCDTAKQAWDALKKQFDNKGYSREISLLRKLCGIWLNDFQSVEEYLDEIQSTVQDLEEINFTIDDRLLVGLMLKGLPEEYEPFVMSLENSGKQLTSDDVQSRIIQSIGASKSFKKADDQAYAVEDYSTQAMVQRQSKNKKKFKIKCQLCGKPNHTAKDCYSKDDDSQDEFKKNAVNGAYVALTAFKKDQEWIIDSGATTHLCKNRDMLTNLKKFSSSILTANNEEIPVTAKGKSVISNLQRGTVEIQNISYAPDIAANLLSVSKICDKGNVVEFTKERCNIYNSEGILMSTAVRNDGLYKLKVNSNVSAANLKKADITMWNRRNKDGNFSNPRMTQRQDVQRRVNSGSRPKHLATALPSQSYLAAQSLRDVQERSEQKRINLGKTCNSSFQMNNSGFQKKILGNQIKPKK